MEQRNLRLEGLHDFSFVAPLLPSSLSQFAANKPSGAGRIPRLRPQQFGISSP